MSGHSEKPFIKVSDNHLVPVNRIVDASFLSDGIAYKVNDRLQFYHPSEIGEILEEGAEITEVSVPILLIHYLSKDGDIEYIRIHSEEATRLWKFLSINLSHSPTRP